MKVVCVDNSENSKYLELCGIYDVDPEESSFPDHYIIRKNNTLEYWVKKEKFATLEEWRNRKIDQII